jgi:hypothetical protein
MKVLFTFIYTSLILLSTLSFATDRSFTQGCPDLKICIKTVSEVTGDKYIFDRDVQGLINSTENVTITEHNATLLLTTALNRSDFTRVPLKDAKTYQILRKRDAIDTLLPIAHASKNQEPSLPNTWDLYTLIYVAEHPEAVEEIAKVARLFSNPTTRILPIPAQGKIHITAAIPDLKNIYDVLKEFDSSPSIKLLKKKKIREAEWRRIEQKNH